MQEIADTNTMPGIVMDISESPRKLSHMRGFVVVSSAHKELARIPYDELLSILVSSYGCSITNRVMQELADKGIPLIITGTNCTPKAISIPVISHHAITQRLKLQTTMREPMRKRIWKQLVQEKITRQAWVLENTGHINASRKLMAMACSVKSGDTENKEAQASREYFPHIFGRDFRRDRNAGTINALLNYGYMVMRSMIARAVVGCGFHPSIGLHHSSWNNTMQLVDDFIEPFRPIVDYGITLLIAKDMNDICNQTKSVLVSLTSIDVAGTRGISPLFVAAVDMIHSYRGVMNGEQKTLHIPAMPKIREYKTMMCNMKYV